MGITTPQVRVTSPEQKLVVETLQDMLLKNIDLDERPLSNLRRFFLDRLIQFGQFYTPSVLPTYIRIQQTRDREDRFRWPALLVLKEERGAANDLWYVEGVCWLGHRLFHHAWATTLHREVVDNVLNTKCINFKKTVYFGAEMSPKALKAALSKKRHYGLYLE